MNIVWDVHIGWLIGWCVVRRFDCHYCGVKLGSTEKNLEIVRADLARDNGVLDWFGVGGVVMWMEICG